MGFKCLAVIALTLSLAVPALASSVAVHDPSVVLVYKDASGNSYPENDANKTRTKYYYLFGTMLGGAYSTDLINWTAFTPKFTLNGSVSTNYLSIFKDEATYAEHTGSSSDVQGNLWAPDIVYNKSLKKWCLYFSLAGNDWKSSIILLTADKIEGPYAKAGVVVYGGMDAATSGSAANTDYKKVTGSSTVDTRYYFNWVNKTFGTGWDGGYGVSAIDPNVFYDQSGNLWLLYGSWSGGLFMLKLDASTGLRDYSYSYGTAPVWSGTAFASALKKDPYMGIHVGGGYYVSGEGSYIEYMKDASGNGYYYMFVSYGFYSPIGGYTMRVFRSKDVTGPYTDVSGDAALFSGYALNYWQNTTYGFPIIQNYRWSFWADDHGEVADGHNSLLTDDDGRYYLVYHRKYNNGTAWHNVEVHELAFNKNGWINALPFEHRVGYGLPEKAVSLDEIAGHYKMILHNPIGTSDADSADKLAVNTEQDLYLNADGSLTGTYTGTWTYDYSNGSHFLSLTTGSGNFEGVVAEQLENDISKKTITFSAMNAAGTRALWGYRVPKTLNLNTTTYGTGALVIGNSDYSTAWNDTANFLKVTVPDSFYVEYKFMNYNQGDANYHNWVLAFVNGGKWWYLRSDKYSVDTLAGTSIGYTGTWGDDWDAFISLFKNKEVTLRAFRSGTTINVFAYAEDSLVYRVAAKATPTGSYTIYLGADAGYLDMSKVSYGTMNSRSITGVIDDGGVYTSAFNAVYSPTTAAPAGNFKMHFEFMNYGNGTGADVWDNFVVRATSGATTMLLRADGYAMEAFGSVAFTKDWDEADFASIMRNAHVDMNIARSNDTITYTGVITAESGKSYNYKAVNAGAPTGAMSFGFTVEQAAVDLLRVDALYSKGEETTTRIANVAKAAPANLQVYMRGNLLCVTAETRGTLWVYRPNGSLARTLDYRAGENIYGGFAPGVYFAGSKRLVVRGQ